MLFTPEKQPRRGGRFASLAASVAIHALVISAIVALPDGGGRHWLEAPNNPSLASSPPRKRRVIWLVKGVRLPRVDSGDRRTIVRPPKAPSDTNQVLFTRPAPQKRQFIFTTPPKLAAQPPIPSPNLISFAGQPIAAPAPVRPQPKPFQPVDPKPQPAAPPVKLEMPQVAAESARLEIPLSTSVLSSANPKLPRPPAKRLVMPEAPGRRETHKGTPLEAPPMLAGMKTSDSALAILSPDPSSSIAVPAPAASRPDSIQIGGSAQGAATPEGTKGATALPGLTVRGENIDAARPGVIPGTRPLSGTGPVPPSRAGIPPPVAAATVSIPLWPNARRVPAIVESKFPDRAVYTTMLTPPGGYPDWILWFGEAAPLQRGVRIFMRPPVTRHMLWTGRAADIASLGGTWVKARISKEGFVDSIAISQGPPNSLPILQELLGSWIFTPAVRNGELIDIDFLLEITPSGR